MTGAELAAIRRAAGLSQGALAQRVGIGRHAVSYWECKAEVDRRAWAVRRIAEVLTLPDKSDIKRAPAGWAERMAAQDRARETAFMAQVAAWQARDAQRREAQRAKLQVRCNARTRKGTPCRCKSEPGKKRCKFHGGMSTGARTPEGLERIREAQRQRWARWRAERDGRE